MDITEAVDRIEKHGTDLQRVALDAVFAYESMIDSEHAMMPDEWFRANPRQISEYGQTIIRAVAA